MYTQHAHQVFEKKLKKNLKNLKKIQKKLEISPNYTVICKNAKKINFFTTTRGSKMCQKLVSNVKFGIWAQKYGVSRNFEFWQKFLPLLLPTEHFPKKCRKMLKNAFFQNCQKSIVFSYFPWKLTLKGVFRTKVRISTTEIWITFVKKIIMILGFRAPLNRTLYKMSFYSDM